MSYKGKISNFLNNSLQESPCLDLVMIRIIPFWILKKYYYCAVYSTPKYYYCAVYSTPKSCHGLLLSVHTKNK